MIKTRFWVLGIAAVLAASLVAARLFGNTDGTTAKVYLDGVCIRTIDLSVVTAPYSFTVEGEAGENTIRVEMGRICVSDADCPDQICVHQGWIDEGGAPIVCLPNKLVVRIESDGGHKGIDSVAS